MDCLGGGGCILQEKSNRSTIKSWVFVCIVIFSLAMLICSCVQIAKINDLNNKIVEQERQIEELNKQIDNLGK